MTVLALVAGVPACGRASAPPPTPPIAAAVAPASASSCRVEPPRRYEPDAAIRERDELFMLLAYAIAFDDWRGPQNRARGIDVAAVLADAEGRPLCWARNSAFAADDATQHAEVRLLTSYLRATPGHDARGLRLYSTLEPCAMCAGMTLMTHVDTVLFGEHAAASGRVYERLAFDGHAHGGYCPYEYTTLAAPAPTPFVQALDRAHAAPHPAGGWVESPARRDLHGEAARALDDYEPRAPANVPVLAAIREFRARVPRTTPDAPYRIGCPSFDSSAASDSGAR